MMKLRVVVTALAVITLVSCSHKKTKTEVPTEVSEAPVPSAESDSEIQAKDLSLDSEGSDSGKIPGLHTVFFEYDKSILTGPARDLAQKDAEWIKAHPEAYLQIEGHCDRHGSIEYNLSLGERRANAVKKYLVSLGVNQKKLTTISYGKERLIDQAESDVADAKNRRGNFRVVTAPLENRKF